MTLIVVLAGASFLALTFALDSFAASPKPLSASTPATLPEVVKTETVAPAAPPKKATRTAVTRVVVKPDNTLGELVVPMLGADQRLADLTASLKGIFDYRSELHAGQVLHFEVAHDPEAPWLQRFEIQLSAYEQVVVDYAKTSPDVQSPDVQSTEPEEQFLWLASRHVKPTVRQKIYLQADITTSFGGSAQEQGVPSTLIGKAINLLSASVDFQRDIWQGSSLELYYELVLLEDTGEVVGAGDLHYVALRMPQRSDVALYRFVRAKKGENYFDDKGRSGKRLLLATPLDGARITSRYGMRKHPVLGYSRMHKGIDFAAGVGSPVVSAGDGVIVSATYAKGYGKLIKVRHANGFQTLYAHLSKIYVRKGQRVKQGKIIGATGATGMVTGPHLHYEVAKNGKTINPLQLRLPPVARLKGEELETFFKVKQQLSREIETQVQLQYAQNPGP